MVVKNHKTGTTAAAQKLHSVDTWPRTSGQCLREVAVNYSSQTGRDANWTTCVRGLDRALSCCGANAELCPRLSSSTLTASFSQNIE